jgi:hypothetical protein
MSWCEVDCRRPVIPSGRWCWGARNPPATERYSFLRRGFLAHPPPRPLGMTACDCALNGRSRPPFRIESSFHSLITGLRDADPRCSHANQRSLVVESLLPRASQRGRRCRRRMRGRFTGGMNVRAGYTALSMPEDRLERVQRPPHPPSAPSPPTEKRGGRRRSIRGRRERPQERGPEICGGQTP